MRITYRIWQVVDIDKETGKEILEWKRKEVTNVSKVNPCKWGIQYWKEGHLFDMFVIHYSSVDYLQILE